ncbi:GSCFA domain-containing protein, partial [uncultured Bacteroides sp.]
MNLRTPVELPAGLFRMKHADHLMLLGSCFAAEMGERLLNIKFRCNVNPYGVIYNPLSISVALREIEAGKSYGTEELFLFRELWHSPMHHGEFSSSDKEKVLENINTRLREAHAAFSQLDYLLLTFGTAWVYESKESGRVVSNCHKQPEAKFTRRKLSVDEIVFDYRNLLSDVLVRNPKLKVLFTVSPIRHVRDGLHANNLSKATLLLAVEQLQTLFPEHAFYFPAYELLLDELRDYRFYADDMAHPSK